MEKYNYLEAMVDDILDYCDYNDFDPYVYSEHGEAHDALEDLLWCEKDITGNSEGGYDSPEKCNEYLFGNLDLLAQAFYSFDVNANQIGSYDDEDIPVIFDSFVRIYLLSDAIDKALQILEEKEN